MPIEQAIYQEGSAPHEGFLARSPGFVDAWLADAQQVCVGFGQRPAGVRCPLALFARPFPRRQVAVVRATDQGQYDADQPAPMLFHLLILPWSLYADLGGDLFLIADQYPPPWNDRGTLPTLEWIAGPPPYRTVEQVRNVLDVFPSRTQTLLGGVQALVDGGRLVFLRKEPDESIVRDLWALLPGASRAELWPATFAFGNDHRFHVAVVPDDSGPAFAGYVHEADAGDYPEGRYELALHLAAERSDQNEIDTLFARRSRGQVLRLALILLAVFAIIPLLLQTGRREDATGPELPPASQFAALDEGERKALAEHLQRLARKLDLTLTAGSSEATLRQAVVELDRQLDARRPPIRESDPLDEQGPVQRRLRVLMWKQDVEGFDTPGLSPVELVDRLQKKLVKEDGRE